MNKVLIKNRILMIINIVGAISLFIAILILVAQIIFNNNIGSILTNLSLNIEKKIVKTIDIDAITKAENLKNEIISNSQVSVYGNNVVLTGMFIMTLLIAAGFLCKGTIYIMNEYSYYKLNNNIHKCYEQLYI